MEERRSDRWVSIVLSVSLHGALVAAILYGFWTFQSTAPPKPTLAIEATVVDARSLKGAPAAPPQPAPKPTPQPEPQPTPQPPPVEPTGPPEPTAEELAQREQAQKDKEARAKAVAQAAEQATAAAQAAQKQKEADAAAAAKRQAQKQHEADLKRQAEQKREEQRQAEAKADAARKAEARKKQEEQQRLADAQAKSDLEADIKRSLAADEHARALAASGALASWESQIAARIQRAWLRPPTARSGIECVLYVTQVPGGAVTNVRIGSCNGDQAVRESIEAAAYRASPLPPPPDPSLFQRDLEITFKPD